MRNFTSRVRRRPKAKVGSVEPQKFHIFLSKVHLMRCRVSWSDQPAVRCRFPRPRRVGPLLGKGNVLRQTHSEAAPQAGDVTISSWARECTFKAIPL